MIPGHATPEGTARYQGRFPEADAHRFFRTAQQWTVSSLGEGTYLGWLDEASDEGYREALAWCLTHGVNFVDTSLNYRHQRSERVIGEVLAALIGSGRLGRDEAVVATKAGYLTPGAVPDEPPEALEVVGGQHSMAPRFLAHQLAASRANLGLATLDIYYLHNPETQLGYLGREEFEDRVRRAFGFLEEAAAAGHVCYYGMATWSGFRSPAGAPGGLSLARMAELAEEIGGAGHRFRFLQLPFNLAMQEAWMLRREPRDGQPEAASVLEVAAGLNITVVASASILQGRLARGLPDPIRDSLGPAATDAERAIQFARSVPGITTALVGMGSIEHARENLGVALRHPVELAAWSISPDRD